MRCQHRADTKDQMQPLNNVLQESARRVERNQSGDPDSHHHLHSVKWFALFNNLHHSPLLPPLREIQSKAKN